MATRTKQIHRFISLIYGDFAWISAHLFHRFFLRMKGLRRPDPPAPVHEFPPVPTACGGGNGSFRPPWCAQLLTPRPAEWFRPGPPPVNYVRSGGDLTFMHMDTTYSPGDDRAVVELHGVTREGHSVWVNVMNFLPNFFIRTTSDQNPIIMRDQLEQRLERKFIKDKRLQRKQYIEDWKRVENVRSILCYRGNYNPYIYYQVFMNNPKHVTAARDFMTKGTGAKIHTLRVEETYEANVLYDLRYMVDHGLHGCQWVTFSNVTVPYKRTSRAQIEVSAQATSTKPLQGK
jgi:hypothetical protein